MNILFLCVANSARSQIAEGLARNILPVSFHVESAGSEPSGVVNPFSIEVMQEINIDISGFRSKFYEELQPSFLAGIDFVISLCAEEVCPTMMIGSGAQKLRWPFPDPASGTGTHEEKLQAFRNVRDQIRQKILDLQVNNLWRD